MLVSSSCFLLSGDMQYDFGFEAAQFCVSLAENSFRINCQFVQMGQLRNRWNRKGQLKHQINLGRLRDFVAWIAELADRGFG